MCIRDRINTDAFRILNHIESLGCKKGVVLNPATPLSYVKHYLNRIDMLTLMTVDVGFAGQPFIEEVLDKIHEAKEWKEDVYKRQDLGIPYRYLTILVKPEDLENAMKSLTALNMKGIHLTIPHKVEVLKYLDVIAEDARIMGAVNTVYVKDGKLYGENTDGKGFITSLKEEKIEMNGKKAMVLGAGGASRAITVELARCV